MISEIIKADSLDEVTQGYILKLEKDVKGKKIEHCCDLETEIIDALRKQVNAVDSLERKKLYELQLALYEGIDNLIKHCNGTGIIEVYHNSDENKLMFVFPIGEERDNYLEVLKKSKDILSAHTDFQPCTDRTDPLGPVIIMRLADIIGYTADQYFFSYSLN